MIKIIDENLEGYTLDDYKKMFGRIDGVLHKREALHLAYIRNSSDSNMLYGNLAVPFEKFIVDLATGYLAGTVTYDIDVLSDVSKDIRKKYFNKDSLDDKQIDEMKSIIEYVIRYNDDNREIYDLIHDLLEYGACYEVIRENENNEFEYTHFDALNTVAIWNTRTPSDLIAIISKYQERDKDNKAFDRFRVVDKFGMRVYDRNSDEEIISNDDLGEVKLWDDIPGFACETDFSITENCETLISTYENLLSNIKDTYKYNAEDCKMKISGYKAQNKLTIKNDKNETIINPDRIKEDEYILNSKTFYTEEGGDADWLIKPVDASGATLLLKYYVDSIFQLAGIPNTADLAFNSNDLNASAIDRKFYVMNMKTEDAMSLIKKGLLRRFELIFNRLNGKFNTTYDFRYITIEIGKNLPSMQDETVDRMLKLDGILSEQTIIEALGYDYESEKSKKEDDLDELQKSGQGFGDNDKEIIGNKQENSKSDERDNSNTDRDEEERSKKLD